jgi:agmatinase
MTISQNDFLGRLKTYLRPPGCGVYTVHTAKDRKDLLHRLIYKIENANEDELKNSWHKSIDNDFIKSNVVLLGAPSDSGGGIQRGANWGPLFLRNQIYQSQDLTKFFDIGDVFVNPHLLHDKYLNDETINRCRESMYGNSKLNLPVSPLSILYDFSTHFHELYKGKKLFTIGGDHSISYPLVRAYLEQKKAQNKNVAVIHFDAHTDLSTERLGIDLCFGTWTSQIIPYLNSPAHLIQIGIRSSAKDKNHWEKTFGHTQIWTKEILELGPEIISKLIVEKLKKLNVDELYVSFDIDCLDEGYAGATGTPEKNGLSPFEPMFILQALFDEFKFSGADITEIAPFVRGPGITQIEPETTLMVASQFANFLIGAMESN